MNEWQLALTRKENVLNPASKKWCRVISSKYRSNLKSGGFHADS
jgi:hypothetical protein